VNAVRSAARLRKVPTEDEHPALAHDLNNDLAIMLAECDLLEILLAGDSAALARVKVIRTAAHKMADRISHTFPQ
jgi:hypothetical protein